MNTTWKGLAITVAMAGMISLPAAAQISRPISADVPFAFTVGDTQLPAGKYVIQSVSDVNENAFEIRSANGKKAVAFLAEEADAPRIARQTELEFTKRGDQEFLTKVVEAGTSSGVQVINGRRAAR